MRTWPVRLIRSQVDSFLGCARAGTDTAATVAAAAATAVAEATSRRRIPISLLLSAIVRLVGPIFAGSYPTLEEANTQRTLGVALRTRQERTQIVSQSLISTSPRHS